MKRLREGNAVDRISIVARKMVERPERMDFSAEFSELCDEYALPQSCFVLCALNAAIWQREDRLRELRKVRVGHYDNVLDSTIASTALEIQALNDRRAELIAELNRTEGEKLYKVAGGPGGAA